MTRCPGLVAAFLLVTAAGVADQSVFRSETRLVVLHATVTDDRGKLVTTLDQAAFTVFENGKRQPITIFRRDDIPVSVGLLIDNSGSMRPLRAKVEAAALAFARASNPQDEMFVLNFADTPHLDVPMTGDIGALEAGITRVDSIGGTALHDAIAMGEAYLRDHARQDARVLLVVTDGNDNASTTTAARIRAQAEHTETVIDAIGLFGGQSTSRASAGRHELTELTGPTGGTAYFPASVGQVESVAVDLARQIRSQYTIGYEPLNQALDGSYRTIRVTASGPDRYKVRTRPGYRAVPAGGVTH
jgi:Ca-activated chloride channel family protein